MKIMLYSQHVLGIGHFFRSMEIAAALGRHKILFVEGGAPLDNFSPPPHVERILLPPLMMDSEFKVMESDAGTIEEVKARRKEILSESFFNFAPDVLITELFPFGRRQFRLELIPILEDIRNRRMCAKAVCSLRDILVEKKDQAAYEERVIEILNRYYHLVMVHSDPKVVRLEETFERVDRLRVPIRYTGYVVRKVQCSDRFNKHKVIVASSGGGKVGVDLLGSAIEAVQSMPDQDLRLRVFIGPFMDGADRKLLEQSADLDSRTSIYPFSPDFLGELSAANLSISMAGYNTCMDILSSGVRAIVYPFPQNREQGMRAGKLEGMGLLRVLSSIESGTLSAAIRQALNGPRPSPANTIDLAGAETAASLVEIFGAGGEE